MLGRRFIISRWCSGSAMSHPDSSSQLGIDPQPRSLGTCEADDEVDVRVDLAERVDLHGSVEVELHGTFAGGVGGGIRVPASTQALDDMEAPKCSISPSGRRPPDGA